MNIFVKRAALFFFLGLVIIVIIGCVYKFAYKITMEDIPAPALSDSYSLNQKLQFLRKRKKTARILAIGSSITLNNLHSETVVDRLKSDAFFNVASWGMNMEDDFLLLKVMHEVYNVDTVIIASSISEFELPVKVIDHKRIKRYLSSGELMAGLFHISCFNLRYYAENVKYTKQVKATTNQYESLIFDPYGGVKIDDTNFQIDTERWNNDFNEDRLNKLNYAFLDSMSSFCKLHKIKLLFFQSPFREGIYKNLNREKSLVLEEYVNRVGNILKRDDHIFIDSDKVLWNDSLFIDGEHMNMKGAKKFTEYCFDQINNNHLSQQN